MSSHPTTNSVEAAAASEAHTQVPVPISTHEAALLRRILSAAAFTGAPQLVEQVRTLHLAPAVSDANFRIYIQHPETPRAPYSLEGRAKIPGDAVIRHPDGHLVAHVDIWVEGGHLRAMHLRWAGDRLPMTLPSADWVETAPAAKPVAPTAPAPAAAPAPAPATEAALAPMPRGLDLRRLGLVLAALCALAVIATAFVLGRSGAADLVAARDAGRQVGQQQGAADGKVMGAFQGSTEGMIAGRQSTYQPAFTAAQAAAQVAARRAAAARAKRERDAAAAAAAAAAYVTPRNADNTSCSGYRDARGYWICS